MKKRETDNYELENVFQKIESSDKFFRFKKWGKMLFPMVLEFFKIQKIEVSNKKLLEKK